ncbi:MAG: DUF4173 domain-containing protein [Coriobacteriia bacterium]|nr:DUF4173 domain-containing protein [Coriobacteriia bacterium]
MTEENEPITQFPAPNTQPIYFPPPAYQWEPAPPAPPAPPLPATLADVIVALLAFIMGFCFWEWEVLSQDFSGISATLFFIVLLAICFVYLWQKGIKQNKASLVMLAVAILGACPFVLNGARDINALLLLFEGCMCLLWVAYSCRTVIAPYLSGFVIGDLFSQVFIVPFGNFGRAFASIIKGVRSSNKEGRRIWKTIAIALIGLVVTIPIFAIVIVLLINSDDGFYNFTKNIFENIDMDRIVSYGFEFLGGIPIACYVFGAMYGNAYKRFTGALKYESLNKGFQKAHALPRVALYAPLVCFVVVYIVYFITMGSYLFSALNGELPASFTYAQYARQGFFELCGVAFINLLILAITYLLARREASSFPVALRILTGSISLLSCLLIVTAMSKMALYIGTYGLSPLRVYTSWFMVLLMFTFLILCIWHIRPFNAAQPIIVVTIILTLALGLTNTDGIVARYNVDRYLGGQTTLIDVDLLARLNDGALPPLYDLAERAPDAEVRKEAREAIRNYPDYSHISMLGDPASRDRWVNWNVQYQLAEQRAVK